MAIFHVEGSARFNDPDKYNSWLSAVKNGDEVLVQKFHPASDSVLDYSFECWQYQLGTIMGDAVWTNGNAPLDLKTGKLKYWNSDADWGEVFPARIVPTTSFLQVKRHQTVFGDKPIYEPLFSTALRLVFFASYPLLKVSAVIRRVLPYSYSLEVEGGNLYHCFLENNAAHEMDERVQAITNAGGKFLYSQFIKR